MAESHYVYNTQWFMLTTKTPENLQAFVLCHLLSQQKRLESFCCYLFIFFTDTSTNDEFALWCSDFAKHHLRSVKKKKKDALSLVFTCRGVRRAPRVFSTWVTLTRRQQAGAAPDVSVRWGPGGGRPVVGEPPADTVGEVALCLSVIGLRVGVKWWPPQWLQAWTSVAFIRRDVPPIISGCCWCLNHFSGDCVSSFWPTRTHLSHSSYINIISRRKRFGQLKMWRPQVRLHLTESTSLLTYVSFSVSMYSALVVRSVFSFAAWDPATLLTFPHGNRPLWCVRVFFFPSFFSFP